MARAPIQVPDETKERMEKYKDKLNAKSLHELIDKLIDSHMQNEKNRVQEARNREQEKLRQDHEMIQLGETSKQKFSELKRELKLGKDANVFEFLREHYQNSRDISNLTFMYYRDLE